MKYRYPKFSVLMTIYVKESPKNFQESLLSLENQTVMPNEIVIVEDGKLSEQLEEILNKHTRKFNGLYKIIKLKKIMVAVMHQELELIIFLTNGLHEWIPMILVKRIDLNYKYQKS